MYPGSQIFDREGAVVGLQISKDGGTVNLTNGLRDNEGFYVILGTGATEGTLRVILFNNEENEAVTLPFFIGYSNPVLIKEIIAGHADNTCTNVYWGK